jgi:formylmethanofuran dehydrogenase subunit B
MSADRRIEHVTCLGCGCGCDDLTVAVSNDRITEVTPACPLGRAWFGDGQVPDLVISDGQPLALDLTIERLAKALVEARGRCLVYLGPDLTSQAQRAALSIADLLKATVDSDTSDTAANGLITAQRRGRASATLGEVRNRGDVFLFWGVDPRERYPRFLSRYSVEPVGTQVPDGRRGRHVIAVSIGADKALEAADSRIELPPDQEIAALSLIRAAVQGNSVRATTETAQSAGVIAEKLMSARYAVLVHDAEPTALARNPLRAEALIALAQALNGPTRAALVSLRAGGNRVGGEAVLTWQTGYPFAVDFTLGYPRYGPERRGTAGMESDRYQAVLLLGSLPENSPTLASLSRRPPAVIGPRASQASFPTSIAIDTGVAGIHDAGTAYRMDEIPLALRSCLAGPRAAADVLQQLSRAIHRLIQARTK